MPHIKIDFDKFSTLELDIENTETGLLYYNLVKQNLAKEQWQWRDPLKYDEQYFDTLCLQVKEKLGWDWIQKGYSIEQTVKMHKFIEDTLEKTKSFRNIPGEHQNLIHEAHFCIHQIQYGNKKYRSPSIQIEWFNDSCVPLPLDKKFSTELRDGDVLLQNPYVGHPPIQCYQQNDYESIDRTCQFHDIIKPGIKIQTGRQYLSFNIEDYINWWKTNCPEYYNVNKNELLHYTGWPVIGKVVDIDLLQSIMYEKELNIKNIQVYD